AAKNNVYPVRSSHSKNEIVKNFGIMNIMFISLLHWRDYNAMNRSSEVVRAEAVAVRAIFDKLFNIIYIIRNIAI
ncbi:hypothetical protein, partial [Acinetobacter sp. MD2(2019)]|uniref:hypothetical protein n=1 Tax=Acinetobacter sp. MD2(2019) TaxID=2605273 RepID=UPI002D764FF8